MKPILAPVLLSAFILTGAFSSCKDEPIGPDPKDSCDTCKVDTTDTTGTPGPNDTTSHAFVWTQSSLEAEASLTGCWVFDDTAMWCVGNDVYSLNRGVWQRRSLKNQHGWVLDGGRSGSSLFGFTPSDIWMIKSTILWHYDGATANEVRLSEAPYNLVNLNTDGAFRAAWGTSSRDMFFVGDKGTIVHYDGTNWTKFPKVTQKNLRSVWGTSSRDVWASGFNSSTAEAVLLHYDGTAWTEESISSTLGVSANGGFDAVWATDSASHKVAITTGQWSLRKTDDGEWRSDNGLVPNELPGGGHVGMYLLHGRSANDLFSAGSWGWVAHWNGSSWHRYDDLFLPSNLNYTSFSLHQRGNTVAVVGLKNGRSWIAIGRRK